MFNSRKLVKLMDMSTLHALLIYDHKMYNNEKRIEGYEIDC